MRISFLAAAVLVIWLLPLSTPAYAGCSGVSCASGGNNITYGSGSYGTDSRDMLSKSATYLPNSHASQIISPRFGAASMAECPPGTVRLSNRSCTLARRKPSVSYSSGAAASSSSMYRSTHSTAYQSTGQVVPFTTTVSKISNYRVAGMGENEFLSPTTCPVSVYNPGGHEVLGCYSVVKPVQAVRPVPQIRYQQIRVVRPIIYVRYPVLMPVPVCRTQTVCGGVCNSTAYSRYGNTWPNAQNNCGGW